jgi:hypothetical protein
MSVMKKLFVVIIFIILIFAGFNLYYQWSDARAVSAPAGGSGTGTASSTNPEGFSAPSRSIQSPVYTFEDAVDAPMPKPKPKPEKRVDPFDAKFKLVKELAVESGVNIYNSQRQGSFRVKLYCQAESRQVINIFMDGLTAKGLISDIKEGGFSKRNYQGKRLTYCDLNIELR